MTFIQQLKLAVQTFLKHSYPEGIPSGVLEKVEGLSSIDNEAQLLVWPEIEKEKNRYNIRLGNQRYPHMKLVFTLEDGRGVFYVDAHDSHFSLPPGMPGYDQLVKLRESNKKLKSVIEASWAADGLPLFVNQTTITKFRNTCMGMTVLAIDDEIQILDMLGLIVKSLGAKFLRAQSAEEARNTIAEHGAPHLVFCDIMMPGESGYDFVDWFKDSYAEIPVYFITGLDQDSIDTIKIAEVLQKPFTAKSVMKIMKKVKADLDEMES